jgi:hypothetical protein
LVTVKGPHVAVVCSGGGSEGLKGPGNAGRRARVDEPLGQIFHPRKAAPACVETQTDALQQPVLLIRMDPKLFAG